MKLAIALVFFINSAFSITGLEVGDKSPITSLKTISGEQINLSEGTNVLVFYRGSWCPYCVGQLKNIKSYLQPKLDAKNIKLIAVSVDKLKVAKKLKRNFSFTFDIVSDPKAETLKKFKIVNKIEDKLVAKYKNSYGIDIEADSGEKHHLVAHPGVFIVREGKVTFADVHVDYKQRTDNKIILKALGL
jgi:peroxiredoxin